MGLVHAVTRVVRGDPELLPWDNQSKGLREPVARRHPPFSLLSYPTPPLRARQSTPSAAPTATPSQGQNSQMSSTQSKPGLLEQLMKARQMMSVGDLAVLKALGEEGGDCEGQALVILQDVSTRIATRT